MMTDFSKVVATMIKFGMLGKNQTTIEQHTPKLISYSEATFRLRAMNEELAELSDAYIEQDLAKIADSLVDLVVFALGTAALHNLPWADLFNEVIRANNDKQVGNPCKLRNEGIPVIDLIKPEGWIPPNIEGILKAYGWEEGATSSS